MGATRGKFLRITHRHSAGAFMAARSLPVRWAVNSLSRVVQTEVHRAENKEARILSESGPLVRELGMRAPRRHLHPVAADPHGSVQAKTRPGTDTGTQAQGSNNYRRARTLERTRRAQTSMTASMPVVCCGCSGSFSRWFQCVAVKDSGSVKTRWEPRRLVRCAYSKLGLHFAQGLF
jgi:hypothetical protein